MKTLYFLLLNGLLVIPSLGQSDGSLNYVANTANASLPGQANTLVGPQAGLRVTNGANNAFIGYQAGYSNSSGRNNSFLGAQAGYNNTTGSSNVFVGNVAGISNMDGEENSFVGTAAGLNNTSGRSNSFFGTSAGFYASTGSQNTLIGTRAGLYVSGSANTFLGYEAGYNTRSDNNSFVGYRAGFNNTTGRFNTFIGVQAGFSNTTGSGNFILGTNAGSNNTSGTANFFVGDNAGGANTTGGFNVFLGTNAGASNTVGANNTAIGFEANVGSGALINATAIGFRAVASANNSLVLGNGANVGIGTSTPSNKLHVVAGGDNQSGLRLENLTSNSPASATGQSKFLTVDGSGNVILASTTSGGRVGADLWQRNGTYLQSTDESAVVIGQGISKTPADYNLFVSKGILTEKVKVAVKNASEWSDYVFAPSYKLAPLAEVATFIRQKGHLPGIPSAAEVVEQGVDMAKMDAKLLEKIEELTLYSIQLEKQNQQQQQINQTLRNELDDVRKLVKQLLDRK